MRINRRRSIFALAALASCRKRDGSGAASRGNDGLFQQLDFAPREGLSEGERALVLLPPNAAELPVLIALHGRGESGRGLDIGAQAWPYNYELTRIHRRLLAPPLTEVDLRGMSNAERLARLNRSL